MQEHLVIIGGVAAGTKAAAKARRDKPDLKISLYTEGKNISYSACGLPYYIEGLIKDENRLLIRTPEQFKEKDNIDIFIEHRVTRIIPENKKVEVKNLKTGEKFEVEYTKLLIATGARPFVPDIEGKDLKNVFALRTIQDGIAIKSAIPSVNKAVIIGAGYIGVEMVESFVNQGLDTTLIELGEQILPLLDIDMASLIEKYLVEEKKVKVISSDGVKGLIGNESGQVKHVETIGGEILDADIVLLSIGVRPNVVLAKEAGIELGKTGAIKVNERMETNIPDVYAAGDCVESINIITRKPVWAPLGSTANKQGRVAAINIAGGNAEFKGILGSAVTKVFDFTVAKTGLSEKEAQKYKFNYEIAIVPGRDRSGYYPGAEKIIIKLIADKISRRLLGSQIVGKGDVDKRINEIAVALNAGMTVDEFLNVDLTYAPPYSGAIDAILTAAQVLQNKLDEKAEGISAEELKEYLNKNQSCCLLDVREAEKYAKKHIEGAENIPFDRLDTEKLKEYKDKGVVVYCEQGSRSYLTALKLKDAGFKDIKFLDGGTTVCLIGKS